MSYSIEKDFEFMSKQDATTTLTMRAQECLRIFWFLTWVKSFKPDLWIEMKFTDFYEQINLISIIKMLREYFVNTRFDD